MSRLSHHFILTLLLFTSSFLILSSCSDDANDTNPTPPTETIPLPSISITVAEDIVDEPKVPATMVVTEQDQVSYNGHIGIEFRGATSQQLFPKKSYGVELWDDQNEDIDASVLGMPEEEDWILYGPYSDKTLLRNRLIYQLARQMGRYASRTKMVDLVINDQPQGLYIWMEKLKRDDERIDINNLKPDENTGDDLTGGYILKIDKTAGNNLGEGYNDLNSFASPYSPPQAMDGQEIRFLYEDPDAEDITAAQRDYITNYVTAFEEALAGDDFANPATGYRSYIDVGSFIDFFLLNEISNNVDGYRLSTFMHKDKEGKLAMGPIWDFNLAFGNANYCGGDATDVWAYRFNERCSNDFWLVPFWWQRLLEDPSFVEALQNRWTELRQGALSNSAIGLQIQNDISRLRSARAITTNNEVWSVIGEEVWPNAFVGESYEAEVAYLENWIDRRLEWLDLAIGSL